MAKNYCTPIPARRISCNSSVEWRIASDKASAVGIKILNNDEVLRDCGRFPIKGDLALNKIIPDTSGIIGDITFLIDFLDEDLNSLEVVKQNYEIVSSQVRSTQLLDGCWVSIYHWSEDEAICFNKGLRNLTDDDWRQQVRSMHKAGITSILIQNVFDSKHYVNRHNMTCETYDGEAFYDSSLYKKRKRLSCKDPIEAILDEADKYDMCVFPGVGMYAWFDFSPESLKWHINVTKELYERYGHHKSFYGWYISEEIMGDLYFSYEFAPDECYKDIQNFFREYTKFVNKFTPTKPVALAPNNIKFHYYEKEWIPILENLDIIIPFSFARSEYNVREIAEICEKTGTHFWVDMEMFAFPFPNGLRPKKLEDMLTEMQNYNSLEQIFGYQYTGIMNEPGYRMELGGEDTERLYTDYARYLDLRRRRLKVIT